MTAPVRLPHPVVGGEFASPVEPGTGWPDDPAAADTPVACDADDVRRLAHGAGLDDLDARVSVCSACPRLVTWREDVARQKRASFADQPYWGRPIPGWGAADPSLLIVGLAPAANGGNRTGRIFTGDPSADWLFASLHRTGWAVQPTSEHAGDGQRLVDARMVATVRCAPRTTSPPRPSATPARRGSPRSWPCCLRCVPSSRSAPSAGTAPYGRWSRRAHPLRRPGRGSGTARRSTWAA
jgi:uracil-DNA glycosylase